MKHSLQGLRLLPWLIAMLSASGMVATSTALAQAKPAAAKTPAPPATGRSSAMLDLTGYWVSVVTEDWAWRMMTAPKGDAGSLPVTAEAKKVAANWDPAADKAAGEACRAYGAAGNIRQPGRLHISWQNDQTLRVDFSAGNQTRLLSFDTSAATSNMERTWAGNSVAEWTKLRNWQEFSPPTIAPVGGTLKVITTNMRPGYLQSNGFPYSENARMTEYFDRVVFNGLPWLVVTTVVEDPRYLREPLIWSTQFKQEPNASKWKPKPCDAS